jgi:hypothetical protein
MKSFFSPKSRIFTSRWLARLMNTLNLLGPALLLCAVMLLGIAKFGDDHVATNQWLLTTAALLVVAALFIRVVWGIGVKLIASREKRRLE